MLPPPRSEPRAVRSSVLARIVTLVVIGGVLAAILYIGSEWYHSVEPGVRVPGGPGPPPQNESPSSATTIIDLLPSAGTASGCITGTPGVPRPTLNLANGTLQANTYNVPSGTVGHVGMCYSASSGYLLGYVNWSHVGGTGGWFSYPQLAYGVNLYDGEQTTYTPQSAAWTLPQTVATTVNESLWVTAFYSIDPPNSSRVSGYDLSFDDFLSEGLPPTLDVPPFVEVEILLDHHVSYPDRWANWTTPTYDNETVTDEPWSVGYWCHGADNGTNGNVSFDFSYGGQASSGPATATIGVNLSAIFRQVEAMLPGASCWTGPRNDFSSFELGEEDLGSEDGALGGVALEYNWTIFDYCLTTHVANPVSFPGVGCVGLAPPPNDNLRSIGPSRAPAAPASLPILAARFESIPSRSPWRAAPAYPSGRRRWPGEAELRVARNH